MGLNTPFLRGQNIWLIIGMPPWVYYDELELASKYEFIMFNLVLISGITTR